MVYNIIHPLKFDTTIIEMCLSLFLISVPEFVVTIAFAGLCGSVILIRARSLQVPATWPLLTFLLPLCLAVLDIYFAFLPALPDAELYSELASKSAHAWWEGNLLETADYQNIRIQTYATFLGIVYAFSNHTYLAGIVANAGLWGLATTYWLRIGQSTLDLSQSSSRIAGLMFVCYPAGVFYSSALLREPITMFLLAVTCWHLLRWIRTQEPRHFVVGIVTSLIIGLLRPELLPVLWFAMGSALLSANVSIPHLIRIGGVAVLGVSLVQIFSVRIPGYLNPFRLSLLEAKRAAETTRPHAYLAWMEFSSWFDVLIAIPIRIIYLLYSPFPWQLHSYSLFIVTLDALYVFVITLVALPALLWGVIGRRADRLFLIWFAFLLLIGYSLVTSTESVASRRRLYALPVLFLFASYEISRRVGNIRFRCHGK